MAALGISVSLEGQLGQLAVDFPGFLPRLGLLERLAHRTVLGTLV